MFPGPLVEANAGDRIVVKVTNKLASGTAIHWHGMYQNGTNWMDGTTGITQCPIPPGQSFTYNFTVSNQWGTFWWHAHASSQYVDGIVGPLVVHSPEEPQLGQYDEDIIMMISDYYHTDSKTLVSWYLSPESEGSEPVPDNGLINGRNPFDCSKDSSAHFPTGNRCDPGAPHAHFSFQKGLRYRIRIINSGAFAAFHFSIDNHRLTVIEVDGVDVQPVEVERIPIHVAQRYSALVDANQTVGNYWVRADMNTNCFNDPNPALDPSVRAIIHYDGAPLTTTVHGADKEEGMAGYVNKTSWEPLRGDATLFQAHQGVSTFDNSQLMVTFNRSMTVELVIINYDEGDHPFHLHGHTFYVLAIGSGGYMFDLSPPLQTKNPLRRDTVTIPAFGHAVIRFVTDNPGIWAFHCHIHWHMEAGLLVQFLSQPDAIQAFNIPEELKAMCK
ncbi:hypothetical protein BGW38_003980 [Lunasporangiospora selenospora]|uniref:Multicopper oxidase with three cupredoxin domains (Includes cell division protein FtsP and spore coat protein CotA) n=1 Tax=Lunasporangiospora selenospora TaxID=979761 RepID=A0A9P6FRX7_9FUNG|nr:hypothetical protein BGW38_003980 [Lunasporangiospora selenospora]